MPTPNLSEIVTTTLRSRTKKLADNVTRNNRLLMELKKNGRKRPFSGGRTIVQELEWDQNGTWKRYAGYEQLNISPSEVITGAEFDIKQAAVAISMSGLEMLQNSGEEQVIDLLAGRIGNAERTFKNMLSMDCYSNGTADGGKQIGGLAFLVPADPTTGIVGGIDRSNAAFDFWRSLRFRAITDGGAALSAANINDYLTRLYTSLCRGADHPTLYIADATAWRMYHASLAAIQRIEKEDETGSGFPTLTFMGRPFVLDGGYQGTVGQPSGYGVGGAPSATVFALNTDYIHFRPHRDRDVVPLDPDRFAVNQDAMVKLIGWAGNMTLSCGFLQGQLNNT